MIKSEKGIATVPCFLASALETSFPPGTIFDTTIDWERMPCSKTIDIPTLAAAADGCC